jgi:hypothetical protein
MSSANLNAKRSNPVSCIPQTLSARVKGISIKLVYRKIGGSVNIHLNEILNKINEKFVGCAQNWRKNWKNSSFFLENRGKNVKITEKPLYFLQKYAMIEVIKGAVQTARRFFMRRYPYALLYTHR